MRALGAALVDIVRALLSYVVPFRWEQTSERDALPSDTRTGFVMRGDKVVTYTRWELRRGRVHPISTRSVFWSAPHPNCRCSTKPTISDPACTCGHPRSEHAYVVKDGPCGHSFDGCSEFSAADDTTIREALAALIRSEWMAEKPSVPEPKNPYLEGGK